MNGRIPIEAMEEMELVGYAKGLEYALERVGKPRSDCAVKIELDEIAHCAKCRKPLGRIRGHITNESCFELYCVACDVIQRENTLERMAGKVDG